MNTDRNKLTGSMYLNVCEMAKSHGSSFENVILGNDENLVCSMNLGLLGFQ